MNCRRGEVWLADLNPVQGSEQAGVRPVVVLQNDAINRATRTVLAIPFTTNLRRAALPTCVQISQGDGGLMHDSVALCHQLRVLDQSRLTKRLGVLRAASIESIDASVLFTLGIVI